MMGKGKRFHIVVSALVFLGLFFAGCAPATAPAPTAKPAVPTTKAPVPAAPTPTPKAAEAQPVYGGILLTNVNTNPPSYDIHQEATLSVPYSFGPCYNSLVKQDPFKVGEIIGDLAERWEVGDGGKTYTFHLHKGVKWHDGQPFSAEDVRYSLDRLRKPTKGTVSPRSLLLSSIKDIEVADKDTVKIILEFPHSAFLGMITIGWEVIMPKHVIEAKGNMKKDVVGTGPFKFVSHDSGVGTVLKKNDEYFVKGRPYLDGMQVFVITDTTTKFAALRTKRLHMTCQTNGITASQAEVIEKEKLPIKIAKTEGGTNWQIPMRHDVAPWGDVRVRKAMDLAIDRREAIRIVSEGAGTIGAALAPNHPWAIPISEIEKLPGYRQPKDADIAEAKKLLAEAGFPKGIDTPVLFRSGPIWEKGAVFYKDQLAKIGINATLDAKEAGTYVSRLYEGRFTISAYKTSTYGAEPELTLAEAYVTGGGKNYSKYSDAQFDRMFDEQRRITDPAKRKEIILKMQRHLLDTVPLVLSHWEIYLTGLWPEVRNYLTITDSYANNKWQEVWLAK